MSQSTADCAYLAGFLDGEGTIKVYERKDRSPERVLKVVNTHEGVLRHLQSVFGGRIYHRSYPDKPWQDIHILQWTRKADMKRILEAILPYMIVKRVAAIELLEQIESSPGSGSHNKRKAA